MPKRKHLYVALYLAMLPHTHTHTHTRTHAQSTQEQMEKTIDTEGNETGIRPPQVLPDLPEGRKCQYLATPVMYLLLTA